MFIKVDQLRPMKLLSGFKIMGLLFVASLSNGVAFILRNLKSKDANIWWVVIEQKVEALLKNNIWKSVELAEVSRLLVTDGFTS